MHMARPARSRLGLLLTVSTAVVLALITSLSLGLIAPPALAASAEISGFVWDDTNNNNQPDAGEQRLAGATVQAALPHDDLSPSISATTDSQGNYTLSLWEGTWTIAINHYEQNTRSWRQAQTIADAVASQETELNLALHAPGSGASPTAVEAKIEILWPHDRQGQQRPVDQAELANIGVYLFMPDGATPVPCQFNPVVRLWRAYNTSNANQTAELLGTGQRQSTTVEGKTFNQWLFNDIDVSMANDPFTKVFFYVTVDGVRTYNNIWSHGADARTYFPMQDIPSGIATGNAQNGPVDARIEIVWPHDESGNSRVVSAADLANVGVDLYQFGTLRSVPMNWNPTVKLYRALNNDIGQLVATGRKTVVTRPTITYPRWEFNDVDVSQARDPLSKVYFYVEVEGVTTYSNIWSHGADARTYFPNPDIPSASCQ
jgi:hypothetical protein